MLTEKGVVFSSDTDTEVIAHLIAHFFEGDMIDAIQKARPLLKGAYALAILHRDFSDAIFLVAHESPLCVGIGKEESYISSDSNSFDESVQEVIFLSNGEVAAVKSNDVQVFDSTMSPVSKETKILINHSAEVSRGDFEHFTLKEICHPSGTFRSHS